MSISSNDVTPMNLLAYSCNSNYVLVAYSSSPISEMTYTVSSGTLNSSIPYHTLVPPVIWRTFGDEIPPLVMVTGFSLCPSPGYLQFLEMLWNVSCHVFCGLPVGLLPVSVSQFRATLAGLLSGILNTWPAGLTLWVLTISDRSCSLLFIISSLVMSSCHVNGCDP